MFFSPTLLFYHSCLSSCLIVPLISLVFKIIYQFERQVYRMIRIGGIFFGCIGLNLVARIMTELPGESTQKTDEDVKLFTWDMWVHVFINEVWEWQFINAYILQVTFIWWGESRWVLKDKQHFKGWRKVQNESLRKTTAWAKGWRSGMTGSDQECKLGKDGKEGDKTGYRV